MKSKNKQILKVTALYVIWNPKSVKCPASISENPVPLFEIPYGSKSDLGQRARLLLAPSYKNNENSTYLQFPLRLLHNFHPL